MDALLTAADGALRPDFDDELLFDDELEPPFIFPNTANKTAMITTEANVTNTIIAVSLSARGISYNS